MCVNGDTSTRRVLDFENRQTNKDLSVASKIVTREKQINKMKAKANKHAMKPVKPNLSIEKRKATAHASAYHSFTFDRGPIPLVSAGAIRAAGVGSRARAAHTSGEPDPSD